VKTIVAVAVALAALAAAAFGRSAPPPNTPGLDRVSNTGVPVDWRDLSSNERALLASSGVRGSLRLLRQVAGHGFYSAESTQGSTCFAVGSLNSVQSRFSQITCQSVSHFPSEAYPLIDMSTFRISLDTNTVQAITVAGVAADGVASVEVTDIAGGVHRSVPKGNIYTVPVSGIAVESFIARDVQGSIVYESKLK
jgi:hypothetical protein